MLVILGDVLMIITAAGLFLSGILIVQGKSLIGPDSGKDILALVGTIIPRTMCLLSFLVLLVTLWMRLADCRRWKAGFKSTALLLIILFLSEVMFMGFTLLVDSKMDEYGAELWGVLNSEQRETIQRNYRCCGWADKCPKECAAVNFRNYDPSEDDDYPKADEPMLTTFSDYGESNYLPPLLLADYGYDRDGIDFRCERGLRCEIKCKEKLCIKKKHSNSEMGRVTCRHYRLADSTDVAPSERVPNFEHPWCSSSSYCGPLYICQPAELEGGEPEWKHACHTPEFNVDDGPCKSLSETVYEPVTTNPETGQMMYREQDYWGYYPKCILAHEETYHSMEEAENFPFNLTSYEGDPYATPLTPPPTTSGLRDFVQFNDDLCKDATSEDLKNHLRNAAMIFGLAGGMHLVLAMIPCFQWNRLSHVRKKKKKQEEKRQERVKERNRKKKRAKRRNDYRD